MFKIENIFSYYRCVFTNPDDDELSNNDEQDERTNVRSTNWGKKDVNRGWLNYLKVTNKTDGRTDKRTGQ